MDRRKTENFPKDSCFERQQRSVGPEENRRGDQIPLELELQAVVSCLIWVLGTKLRSF